MPARDEEYSVLRLTHKRLKGFLIIERLEIIGAEIRKVRVKLRLQGAEIVDVDFRAVEVDGCRRR